MSRTLGNIRDRYHPLLRLRKHRSTAALLRAADRPCWQTIDRLPAPVRVRRISHASYIALGTTEPDVVAAFAEQVRRREIGTFWDVGANFGYYGWLLKALRPEARVVLFEPEPRNVGLLYATQQRHGFTAVEIVAAAVSDHAGRAAFSRDPDTGCTGSVGGAGDYTVPTIILDDRGEDVDLLKVDVEGHERQVIAGAARTIERCKPVIFIECLEADAEPIRFLVDRGYRPTRLDRSNYLLTHGG